ncbi:hypothetical protein V8E54_001216 [Elaphomyces granulatus]|jgi:hypothetical protein
MDREEMVEADSNDMFENDLDRLSRDANPGPLLLERFYRTLKVIMMVGLESERHAAELDNEAAND